MTTEHEHEFEAAPGLPEALPPGEKILWQGAPHWTTLALRAYHVRGLAIYFGVLLIWRLAVLFADGAPEQPDANAYLVLGVLAGLALATLGVVCLIAWLASRTTLYTITNRRVVMRLGVVLCITFNLPFPVIETVALRRYGKTGGDLALRLKRPNKIAIFHLWPHARPWRLAEPEPMLRALTDAPAAGEILARAMSAATGIPSASPSASTSASPSASPSSAQGTTPGAEPQAPGESRPRVQPSRPRVSVGTPVHS
jgi:hypothetical protein